MEKDREREQRKKAIKDLLKNNPDQCYTAVKLNKILGIANDYNAWGTHGILLELENKYFLIRCPHGPGFKYNSASAKSDDFSCKDYLRRIESKLDYLIKKVG